MFHLFRRAPRCIECRTTDNLHLVHDGIEKGYVCSTCAVKLGYIDFLPSLRQEIIAAQKRSEEFNMPQEVS